MDEKNKMQQVCGGLINPLVDLSKEGVVYREHNRIVLDNGQMVYEPSQSIGSVRNGIYYAKPILTQKPFNAMSVEEQAQLIQRCSYSNNYGYAKPGTYSQGGLQGNPIPQNSMPLAPSHFNRSYSTNGNFLIYNDSENGRQTELTNYHLEPREKIITFEGDKQCENEIRCTLYINSQEKQVLDVRVSELKNLHNHIMDRYPEAICNIDAAKVSAHIEASLRQQIANGIPTKLKQKQHGWSKITGRMEYFHDGTTRNDIYIETHNKIAINKNIYSNNAAIIETLHLMMNTTKHLSISAPLVATAFLGILFRLFTEAGISPQFAVFIYGASGTMKTSYSKVLFSLFNTDDMQKNRIVSSFKDTMTSYEMRFKECKDTVLLLDDYHPTVDPKNKKAMEAKAEEMIRFVGDGIGKNRSNAFLEDVKGSRPEGMLVITGEETLGTNSTMLRTLFIHIERGDIIPDKLSIFQNDPLLWTTVLQRFIDYVQFHYYSIIEYIQGNTFSLREKYKFSFKELRPCDQMVVLDLTYHIIGSFLLELGCPNSLVCTNIAEWVEACFNAITDNCTWCACNSTEAIYAVALYNCIVNKEIHIAESKLLYERNLTQYQGFEEDSCYILDSSQIHPRISNSISKSGRTVCITENEGINQLRAAELLITSKNGRTNNGREKIIPKVKVTINNDRKWMLKIPKSLLEQFVSSIVV